MAPISDDDRPDGQPGPATEQADAAPASTSPGRALPTEEPAAPELLEPRNPPYQALFPNLDRVSRSAFRPGTVSRRRIRRATGLLAGVVAIIAVLIGANLLL